MMRKSTKAKSIFTALAFAMLSTAVLTACSDSPQKGVRQHGYKD